MRIGGRDHGRIGAARVKNRFLFAGPDQVTAMPFDNWETEQGSLELVITDLYLRLPTVTLTMPAGLTAAQSYIDGILYGYFFGGVTILTSDLSPTMSMPCGRALMDKSDQRELESLSFMSGRPVYPVGNRAFRPYENIVPANSLDSLSGFSREIRQRDNAYLQFIGPYLQAPALVGGTFSFRPRLRIPLGWRQGERWGGENPIPARWLTGRKRGGGVGATGELQVTAPSILPFPGGGIPLSWGTDNIDVEAVGFYQEADKIGYGPVPYTRRIAWREGEFTLWPWTSLALFRQMPDLLADGGMPADAYGERELKFRGEIVTDRDPTVYKPMLDMALRIMDGGDSPWAYEEVDNQSIEAATFPGPGGAQRVTRWGDTVWAAQGSLLDMVGSTTGERCQWKGYGNIPATNNMVEAGFFGPTKEANDRHNELYGYAKGCPYANDTEDGSPPSKSVNGAVPLKPVNAQLTHK